MFMPAISAIGAAVPVAASMVRSYGSAPKVVDTSPIASMLTRAEANASANNAWSAQQASQQMAFQKQMQETAMRFNAAEAAKNRDWQQYMSSMSHQREVADLKAAGLNPILSAMGGNGAAVGSGATAAAAQGASGAMGQTDTSANNAIATLLSSWISSLTALENQRVSAQSNEAVADKYNAMTAFVEQMKDTRERQFHAENLEFNYSAAQLNAAVSRYISDNNLKGAQATAAASVVSAQLHKAASEYAADKNYLTSTEVAKINSDTNKELKRMGVKADFAMQYLFPNNKYSAASSLGLMGSAGGYNESVQAILKDLIGGYGITTGKKVNISDLLPTYTQP